MRRAACRACPRRRGVAAPGRARRARRPRRRRRGIGWRAIGESWGNLVRTAVSGDVLPKGLQGIDPDPREAGELELDLERRRILLGRGDEAMRHGPQLPATRIVLEASQSLDELAVLRAPVPAPDARDAAGDRPLRGDVDLLDARLDRRIRARVEGAP